MNTHVCLFDWDGTLRPGYLILDWLRFLHEENVIGEAHIERLQQLSSKLHSGEIKYNVAVWRSAVIYSSAIKGVTHDVLQNLALEFVERDNNSLFEYTKDILNYLCELGFDNILVSGSPIHPLFAYKQLLPISEIFATEVAHDHQTGRVIGAIKSFWGTERQKTKLVSSLIKSSCVVLAMGDSEADTPLLKYAKIKISVSNPFITINSKYIRNMSVSANNLVDSLKPIINAFTPEEFKNGFSNSIRSIHLR